jgi:hypothetical protein
LHAWITDLVGRLPLRVMAALFGVHLVVMAAGAARFQDGHLTTGLFNIDGEGPRWFVVFSTVLLLAGAVVGAVVRGRPALVFGGFLAFMAVDEALQVHERLETATGIDWPVLYLPVMAAAGLAALALLRRHRGVRWFVPTLLAGGACWAGAVVLEKIQWDPSRPGNQSPHYDAYMITEELLEATGSYLFAVALALVVRAGLERRRERRAGDTAAADGERGVVRDDAQLLPELRHVSAEV